MQVRTRARWLAIVGLVAMLLIGPALASHAVASGDVIGNGHYWPFKKTPVTITFGDNLDSKWEGYFDDALRRWNKSDVIKGKSTRGSTNGTDCAPKDGTVQVCNAAYGQNKGWLGLTQIRFNKSKITSVTVQFNDSFFGSGSKYNDPRAKQHTACHEMGHAIGLDHETTKSCMNDSESAIFNNTKPINRDFKELRKIYSDKNRKKTAKKDRQNKRGTMAPAGDGTGILTLEQRETTTTTTLPDGSTLVTITTWAD